MTALKTNQQDLVLTQLRANVEQMRTGAREIVSGSEKALRLLEKAHGKQDLTLTGNQLLEALKKLYRIMLDGMIDDYDEMTVALGEARHAIAAAEGEE